MMPIFFSQKFRPVQPRINDFGNAKFALQFPIGGRQWPNDGEEMAPCVACDGDGDGDGKRRRRKGEAEGDRCATAASPISSEQCNAMQRGQVRPAGRLTRGTCATWKRALCARQLCISIIIGEAWSYCLQQHIKLL